MDQAKEAAQTVQEFFQGNPFATQAGRLVEMATDGSLPAENWELNIQICDMVNYAEEHCRDALRAIRKCLQMQMGKQHTSVMYTLTLLETVVKNGNRRVHEMVMKKDFIQSLVVIIGPKFDPPQVIQEKVLNLIQCWADAFRTQPALSGVVEVYDELKAKGVEFPMTDIDAMTPILTPKPRVPLQGAAPVAHAASMPVRAPHPAAPVGGANQVQASSEQLAKLRHDLDIVNSNLRVLREMLSELHPGHEAEDDLQLLRELNSTCRHMQQRCVQLLAQLANEQVINELLVINDEMNNVFEKYDRYMDNRGKAASASAAALPSPPSVAGSSSGPANLIDLSAFETANGTTPTTLDNSMKSINLNDSQPFDMFAQTRHTTLEQERKGGSTYADNSVALDQTNLSLSALTQVKAGGSAAVDKPSDLAEMDAWLKQHSSPPQSASAQAATTHTSSGTTKGCRGCTVMAYQYAEFDDFLQSRATHGSPQKSSNENDGL